MARVTLKFTHLFHYIKKENSEKALTHNKAMKTKAATGILILLCCLCLHFLKTFEMVESISSQQLKCHFFKSTPIQHVWRELNFLSASFTVKGLSCNRGKRKNHSTCQVEIRNRKMQSFWVSSLKSVGVGLGCKKKLDTLLTTIF